MEFDILIHRQWLYRSRVITRCIPFLILCSLCFMAFLVLSAFEGSFLDPSVSMQHNNTPHVLIVRHSHLNNATDIDRAANTRHVLQNKKTEKNRTILPDDCFHSLLRSVDPTCDLGMFCTETWRQEDILCHVFLHQVSLVPGPAQCELPLGHHDMVEGEEGEEVETYKDEEGLNNININEKSMASDQENVHEIHESEIALSGKSDFIVKEQEDTNAENNARRAKKTFWARDREKLKGRNNEQIINTLTEVNKDKSFWSLGVHLNDRKDPSDDDTKEIVKSEHIEGDEGEVRVKQKVKDVVPRIAYYVLVSESCKEPFFFQFLHYLSMLSVQRFLRPRAIYVLGNCVPIGYWWSRVVNDVRAVRFVHRPRPLITKDGQVKWISHLADVIRLQVLLVNGGVYVDTDMILLRPLDPLLGYPLTMGLVDNNTGMGNALILATRGSLFLKEWYSGYMDFRPLHFHYNGMWAALRQWHADPDSVHMESKRFYSPNWYEANLLFYDNDYDISQSYAVHIWHRHAEVPTTPEQFLTLNTTLGRVFRRVYFGV